jgi:hypothetical protein
MAVPVAVQGAEAAIETIMNQLRQSAAEIAIARRLQYYHVAHHQQLQEVHGRHLYQRQFFKTEFGQLKREIALHGLTTKVRAGQVEAVS